MIRIVGYAASDISTLLCHLRTMYVCKKSMTLFSSKPSNPQHCIFWNGLIMKWIQSSYISVKSHWRYGVSNHWQLEYLFNNLLGLIKGWHQSRWTLQWRHNERDGVSNHQFHDCLLKRLFRRRSKKISKRRVTRRVTSEFPTPWANNAKIASIWWCHHALLTKVQLRKKQFHFMMSSCTWWIVCIMLEKQCILHNSWTTVS